MAPPSPINVVAALIWRDDHLLICRRPEGGALAGQWEFPGGKIDPGETPEEALARELREELGVETRVGERIFEHVHAYTPERIAHLLFFRVQITAGKPQRFEHQDMRWVAPSALPAFDFVAGDGPIIEKLTRGEIPPVP